MITRRHLVASAAAAATAVLPGAARAEGFPNHAVRIVVPFSPGGTGDVLCRLLQEPLQRILGQPVIVENRIGASGSVGSQHVKNSPPDGYTLLQVGNSTVTTALLQKAAGYDAITDFAPVALVATTPMVFLVNPSVPATTLQQLIDFAKANPDKLEFSSAGRGSLAHLGTEFFNQAAGVRMVFVPYQGSAQAVNAVLANEVKVSLTTPSDAVNAFVGIGKLRMLAVSSPRRSPLLPNVPAISETLPGFGLNAWFGLSAPAGTPRAIVAQLNAAVNKALGEPGMQEKLRQLAMTPQPISPAAFGEMFRTDRQIWTGVIAKAGIEAE